MFVLLSPGKQDEADNVHQGEVQRGCEPRLHLRHPGEAYPRVQAPAAQLHAHDLDVQQHQT